MRVTGLGAAVLVMSAAFASEPGQPLDCSDWVFHESGLSCTVWQPYVADTSTPNNIDEVSAFDMARRLIHLRTAAVPAPQGCLFGGDLPQVEIVWFDGATEGVIAHIPPRCNVGSWEYATTTGSWEGSSYDGGSLEFDAIGGVMLVTLNDLVGCSNGGDPCPTAHSGMWAVAIHGFTTTFDVLQTYTPPPQPIGSGVRTPQPGRIGFRVPYMPEGMPAADHFDTYYGPLTHPIDFSQAQGLACGYPTTVPAVGDYLEVADTLPDPAPGTGRYFVTAATYQGQTRYGRKTSNRVMSGRDPAGLAACGSGHSAALPGADVRMEDRRSGAETLPSAE